MKYLLKVFLLSVTKSYVEMIFTILHPHNVSQSFFFNLKLKPSSRAFSQGPVLSGDEMCNSQPKLVIFKLLYEKFFQNIKTTEKEKTNSDPVAQK